MAVWSALLSKGSCDRLCLSSAAGCPEPPPIQIVVSRRQRHLFMFLAHTGAGCISCSHVAGQEALPCTHVTKLRKLQWSMERESLCDCRSFPARPGQLHFQPKTLHVVLPGWQSCLIGTAVFTPFSTTWLVELPAQTFSIGHSRFSRQELWLSRPCLVYPMAQDTCLPNLDVSQISLAAGNTIRQIL